MPRTRPSTYTSTITVTIEVNERGREAPSITNIADGGDHNRVSRDQKLQAEYGHAVFTYTASDDEDDNKALKWSVTEPATFSIEGGVLRFESPPNYEALSDNSQGKRVHTNGDCHRHRRPA